MNKVQVNVAQVKKLRRALGLSQSDMASACQKKRLNIALSTIKRVESGKSVSLRTIRNIALFHQCPIEQLIESDKVIEALMNASVSSCSRLQEFIPSLEFSGYDFELEQFDTSLRRAQKLTTSHLICLKSDKVQQADMLLSFLLQYSVRQQLTIHQIRIKQDHQLWFTPLKLLANSFYQEDTDAPGEVRTYLSLENRLEHWLQDITSISLKNKQPRVIFIEQLDNAQQLFISQLIKIIHATAMCPFVFVVSANTESINLAFLQRKVSNKTPKLTIELAERVIEHTPIALMEQLKVR